MDFPFEILTDYDRPWGKFTQYTHNQKSTVKLIEVRPKQKLSVQRHQHRDELWVALDEGLWATIDEEEKPLFRSDPHFIPRGTVHTIRNDNTHMVARFLEISFGEFDENDIERLEDIYGRA